MSAFQGSSHTRSSRTVSNGLCMHAVDISTLDIRIDTRLLDFINNEVSVYPTLTRLPNIEQLAFARYLLGRARELHGGQQTSTPGDWLRALSLGLTLRAECRCNALSSTRSNGDTTTTTTTTTEVQGLGISNLPEVGGGSGPQDSFQERYVYAWQNTETDSPHQFRNPFYYTPSIYSQHGNAESVRDSPSSTLVSPHMVLERRASAPSTSSVPSSSSSSSSSSYSPCGSSSSSFYSNDDDDDDNNAPAAWCDYTWSASSVFLPYSPIATTASSYARLALIPSFTSTIRPSSSSSSSSSPHPPSVRGPTYRTVFTPRANDASSLCSFSSATAWSVAQPSLADVRVRMLDRWAKGRVNRTVSGKVRRGLRRAKTKVVKLENGKGEAKDCCGLEGKVSFFPVGF